MTVFLTAQQVLFIHARLIETTGGEHGIRDLGLAENCSTAEFARRRATKAAAARQLALDLPLMTGS